VPLVVAALCLAGLLVALNPVSVARAIAHVDARVLVLTLPLGATFYLIQGLRWHLLLRAVGVRMRLRDTEVVNMAGQAITAMLPLGDLTRAYLVSETAGCEFGTAVATVTVQELSFSLLLVLLAAPGSPRCRVVWRCPSQWSRA
jgi:uncharacterized protein (TIRG00374 family)